MSGHGGVGSTVGHGDLGQCFPTFMVLWFCGSMQVV